MKLKFTTNGDSMIKDKLPPMFERIQRCRFCGREVKIPALSFAENPSCKNCFGERQRAAGRTAQFLAWKEMGDYLVLTDLAGQKPQ